MKQHKWHKEIKAWADGLTIQYKDENFPNWIDILYPDWDTKSYIEFRIKPQPKEWLSTSIKDNTIFNTQPKEPQYLYVYIGENNGYIFSRFHPSKYDNPECIGKIKLEVEDDI